MPGTWVLGLSENHEGGLVGPPLCCTGPTLIRFLFAVILVCLPLVAANAQAPSPTPQVRSAQSEFARGVNWLHSFMYEDAIDAFREAQKIDPGFAMAYWGEAMSFSQPLWSFEEVDKGKAALAKLDAGATLVQLYSALVFDGPELIARIKRGLLARSKTTPSP